MKIAIVLNTSWNIYNFRMGLIRHLIGSGHQVVAIAPVDGFTKHITDAGCDFINLTMDSRGINPIKDAALTLELYRIYKEVQPDIILHFTIKPNIYGSIAARLLNIPVINNVSGLGTVFLWNNFASSLALWMYKFAFRSVDFVFFQNNHDKKHFVEKVGVSGLKTDILPGSGIDTTAFRPNGQVTNDKFTFLVIARLLIDKGIEEFVDAVKILKSRGVDARFQLLGNIETTHKRGVPIKKIKSWIDQGLIDYKGTTEDVSRYIRQSDCVVLPSYREGTPRTLLEGASLAKPLIATDVPGCNNVVVDGFNGYLCKVKNPVDLANKMSKMISLNRDELTEMGKNSRIHIEKNFDEKAVIDKYDDAIDQLLSISSLTPNGRVTKNRFHSRAAAVNL